MATTCDGCGQTGHTDEWGRRTGPCHTLTRIKVITSYAGHARWLAEMPEADWNVGTIPRQPHIPSPYAYAPTHTVSRWNGQNVIVVETRQRRYEVFRVDGQIGPREA